MNNENLSPNLKLFLEGLNQMLEEINLKKPANKKVELIKADSMWRKFHHLAARDARFKSVSSDYSASLDNLCSTGLVKLYDPNQNTNQTYWGRAYVVIRKEGELQADFDLRASQAFQKQVELDKKKEVLDSSISRSSTINSLEKTYDNARKALDQEQYKLDKLRIQINQEIFANGNVHPLYPSFAEKFNRLDKSHKSSYVIKIQLNTLNSKDRIFWEIAEADIKKNLLELLTQKYNNELKVQETLNKELEKMQAEFAKYAPIKEALHVLRNQVALKSALVSGLEVEVKASQEAYYKEKQKSNYHLKKVVHNEAAMNL